MYSIYDILICDSINICILSIYITAFINTLSTDLC